MLAWARANLTAAQRRDLHARLDDLVRGPFPDDGTALILPLAAVPTPNAFSVPFDECLLAYRVTIDIPTVILTHIHKMLPTEARV